MSEEKQHKQQKYLPKNDPKPGFPTGAEIP